MQLRGRHWVVVWLALFLGVASIVVARQSAAYRLASQLGQLREERRALEAQRAELERRISVAGSRAVLVPRAERLGLHLPSDSEFKMMELTPPGERR